MAKKQSSIPTHPCADNNLEWREANKFDGPRQHGWSIIVSADSDGNLAYDNVEFCPWCGEKLPVVRRKVAGGEEETGASAERNLQHQSMVQNHARHGQDLYEAARKSGGQPQEI